MYKARETRLSPGLASISDGDITYLKPVITVEDIASRNPRDGHTLDYKKHWCVLRVFIIQIMHKRNLLNNDSSQWSGTAAERKVTVTQCNLKMPSDPHKNFCYKEKTVWGLWSSYLYDVNPSTGKNGLNIQMRPGGRWRLTKVGILS